MRKLDRIVLRRLLPKLLSNVCPPTVVRSGTKGEQVNCFTTTIRDVDEAGLVLLRMSGEAVECLRHDGHRYTIEELVRLDDINPSEVSVTHFYGLDEVRYEGVWAIARGLWTRWPYLYFHARRLANRLAQWLFNRRAMELRRRLDVLREVVSATAEGDEVDAMDLMNARYGYRWASHPDWESHHRLLERQLEYLTETGELRKGSHGFTATGQALKTLHESEDADRKHNANLRVQLLLAILTFVSAVLAAAQAGLLKLPVLLNLS